MSVVEYGSSQEPWKASFTLTGVDHTLANPVRYFLNQDRRVTFCGYVIPPHTFDDRVTIRVETATGDPSRQVLEDSCQVLKLVCEHVKSTFDQAVEEFKAVMEPQAVMELEGIE